ncbi:MAG: alpha/beta fold hydrolase [Candidatus Aenigmarchaeota archaeon]|nr:alpha/beta fold hydrolase [Candidatus Aenigmarchaeota archaeon]
MQEEIFFGNGRGEKLAGVVHYRKEISSAVILCHGFRSSKENKAAWAERLSDNFVVLRFDLSGHGESDGELKDITITRLLADMNAAIDFMIARGAKTIGLAGHSLGGSLSILASERAKAICSLAGATDFGTRNLNRFGLLHFDQDAKKYDFYRTLKKSKTPALFIHGDRDEVVPLWHSEKGIQAATEGSRMEIIRGMDHSYAGHYDKIISLSEAWFKERLG